MSVRRVLRVVPFVALAAIGVGGPASTAASTASGLITTVDPTRAVFKLHDSAGHSMDTLKVVSDPTKTGRFLGVYHWASSTDGFDVGVATSTDLRTWTYRRTIDTRASQPYLAFSPKNGPVLADEGYQPSHLRFRYWTSVSKLLGSAAPYLTFDAPKTLSSCAEGTPDIRSISYASSTSVITKGSTITVGHHYYANCQTDREAVGVLTNFKNWTTQAQPAIDDRLTAAGAVGKHGDRDTFSDNGEPYTLYEGAISATSGPGDWRNFLDDGTTATEVDPGTPGGSTAFANPSTTVATVNGTRSLIITEFIPSEGAGSGEAGELIYWNPLS
jgi:hypothetical protein